MQNATAEVIPITGLQSDGYRLQPVLHDRVHGKSRDIFVKKLRDIADQIERGELDGVRAQWLDTHGLNLEDDGTAVTGMETLTRTAWTEDGSGTVQLLCTTVVEEG